MIVGSTATVLRSCSLNSDIVWHMYLMKIRMRTGVSVYRPTDLLVREVVDQLPTMFLWTFRPHGGFIVRIVRPTFPYAASIFLVVRFRVRRRSRTSGETTIDKHAATTAYTYAIGAMVSRR